jgi:hypothetical protein
MMWYARSWDPCEDIYTVVKAGLEDDGDDDLDEDAVAELTEDEREEYVE